VRERPTDLIRHHLKHAPLHAEVRCTYRQMEPATGHVGAGTSKLGCSITPAQGVGWWSAGAILNIRSGGASHGIGPSASPAHVAESPKADRSDKKGEHAMHTLPFVFLRLAATTANDMRFLPLLL
jgi:hypothetical protein